MNWTLKFSRQADKQFNKLPIDVRIRIKKAIEQKLLVNPLIYLEPLIGDLSGFYKFRVGNYRLLCAKNDKDFFILMIKVKHRKEIYK